MMFDMGIEVLRNLSEEFNALYDGVFGVEIYDPSKVDEFRFDERGREVMSVEEAQAEYARYLSEQMNRLIEEIDTLILAINDAIPPEKQTDEVRRLLQELSHPVVYKEVNGVRILVDPGGLKERLGTGKWILDHYDFYTKQLVYETPEDGKTDWVKNVATMQPEQVLSEAYWPISQRAAVRLPDLPTPRATS